MIRSQFGFLTIAILVMTTVFAPSIIAFQEKQEKDPDRRRFRNRAPTLEGPTLKSPRAIERGKEDGPGAIRRNRLGSQETDSTPSAAGRKQELLTDVPPVETSAAELPVDLMVQNPPILLKAEAYAGRPYGVGKLSFRLGAGDEIIDRTGAVMIDDLQNRILYPVITRSAFRTFLQTVTGNRNATPGEIHNVWFLFQGDQPLQVVLRGSGDSSTEIPIEFSKNRQYERFVGQWWQAFTRSVQSQIESGDYPPIVETYLTTMVGKRLGLNVPDPWSGRRDELLQTFEWLFNGESIRLEQIQNSMMYGEDTAPATLPVPPPIQWTPLVVTNLPEGIEIESIAKCVPEECFYLRFGTWQNQIWLQQLMEEFGGNLGQMIQLRGFKYRIQSKFLNQLAIQSTEWDQLFGGNLIDDVAVIGMDTYFDDGSAVGVLLHAKDTKRLRTNLQSKRNRFVQEHQAQRASLEAVQVGKYTIELLSTPDNRYRSFYAVSGNCHLMTTSRKIAERFLEAGEGIRSLADSDEYRYARYYMPLDRDDTVFVYMSTRFLQNLLRPQYQVELRRRNQIITNMMMLEMAKLAAANEGEPVQDVPSLIQKGFLPDGFGSRPDNGVFLPIGNHWVDSIRGRRGFFIPIPDMELAAVTPEENAWYRGRADFFANSISSLDPMFVALKRYEFQDKIERVVFDARIAPFGEEKYGWLTSMLGPPLQHEIAPNPDDIVRLQASMRGGVANPNIPPHQVFAAIQNDFHFPVQPTPTSFLRTMDLLKEVPGYIGAWPSPGYLDWMPALGGQPDAWGYTYSRILKLWRLQWEGYSVVAFDQQRLEELKPHLGVVPSSRPAQIRLEVANLAQSGVYQWANSLNYRRSWQTSIANVKFLNLLTQQFRVSPQHARKTAERMLDVELVCSLDGEYQLVRLPSGRGLWSSTAWPSFSQPEIPDGHTAPLMKWFRGLELEVIKGQTQFAVHGFLDVERSETKSSLPSFDMFGGFGSLLGMNQSGEKKSNAATPERAGTEPRVEKPEPDGS